MSDDSHRHVFIPMPELMLPRFIHDSYRPKTTIPQAEYLVPTEEIVSPNSP